MTKIYARNLIAKIADNVVAHHYVQTAKGKLQRVVKCKYHGNNGDEIEVTTARRGESSVSATDVYYDTDVFKLNDLLEYYADKQDIYKVMYPELDTNIAWNMALGDKK